MFDGIPYVQVFLTQDFVAKVSPEDASAVLAFKWYACRHAGGKVYAARMAAVEACKAPVEGRPARRKLYLHRVVADAKPGFMVDHFDGDGLNCQRDNLLVCNEYWNAHNRDADIGRSGFRGISKGSFRVSGKLKWRARITRGQQEHYLGEFDTAEEAARMYDAKAIELFGPLARTNHREGRFNKEWSRFGDPPPLVATPVDDDIPF